MPPPRLSACLRALLLACGAAAVGASDASDLDCLGESRYLCEPRPTDAATINRVCVSWNDVLDDTSDCPQGDDESMVPITFCPPRFRDTGAVHWYTFRTNPGVDFATLHRQSSASTRPCQFPFTYDGVMYTECTKQPVTDGAGQHLFGTASEQTAHAWCMGYTEDGAASPLECTQLCGPGEETSACNPYMAMPFLASSTDRRGCDLTWEFTVQGPQTGVAGDGTPTYAVDPWQGASQMSGCKALCDDTIGLTCDEGTFCDYSTGDVAVSGLRASGVCQACGDCMVNGDTRSDPCGECDLHISTVSGVEGFKPTQMATNGQGSCRNSCNPSTIAKPLQYPLAPDQSSYTAYTLTVYHPQSYLLADDWVQSKSCVQVSPKTRKPRHGRVCLLAVIFAVGLRCRGTRPAASLAFGSWIWKTRHCSIRRMVPTSTFQDARTCKSARNANGKRPGRPSPVTARVRP